LLITELIEKKVETYAVKVETLDHLGIVAGLIDKLKLVERIDARVPISAAHGAIVSHGQSIKAMIVNGLGFTQNLIYLSPTFLEGKEVSALIGEGQIQLCSCNDLTRPQLRFCFAGFTIYPAYTRHQVLAVNVHNCKNSPIKIV
jgi:hypothetical protein